MPLVNDRPSKFFQASRGLRQGCPLSPFLYILMEKYLSRKILAELDACSLPGIKIARGLDLTNHALCFDDSLFLGGASLIITQAFNEILQNFCLTSGALINKNKSVIYGWNVDHRSILRLAHSLGFPSFDKWDKITYLGLPLTLGPNPSSLWLEVICKLKTKIIS